MIILTERPCSHLYQLRSDVHQEIYTGVTAEGFQVVIGPDFESNIIIYFDREGNYALHRQYPFFLFPPELRKGLASSLSSTVDIRLPDESACRLSTIRIRRFQLPGFSIGLFDYPSHWYQAAAEPSKLSPEELLELQLLARDWFARGDYVLLWNNEFYINACGEITAT